MFYGLNPIVRFDRRAHYREPPWCGFLAVVSDVVEIHFANPTHHADCCDRRKAQLRWGDKVAHRLSRRLQQIQAMQTLSDLDFLPCDVDRHDDGTIEVAVTAEISLLLQPRHHPSTQGPTMNAIEIINIVAADLARSS